MALMIPMPAVLMLGWLVSRWTGSLMDAGGHWWILVDTGGHWWTLVDASEMMRRHYCNSLQQ